MLDFLKDGLEGLKVDEERCRGAMSPELFATEEACRLVAAGVPFREAYRRVAASLDEKSQNGK